MTIEQFNSTGWTGKMSAVHKTTGKTHQIVGVDFGEQLVALTGMVENEPDRESWVRCENITLNPPNVQSSATATVTEPGLTSSC